MIFLRKTNLFLYGLNQNFQLRGSQKGGLPFGKNSQITLFFFALAFKSDFSFPCFPCFSTMELIFHCKNSEFCLLSFFINFLHDFILFGLDMHQNRSISLFEILIDHFHFFPLAALKCYPHLILCPICVFGNIFLDGNV